jgi:hypothetical protein
MNIGVWWLAQGYSSSHDAETTAKDWTTHELVAGNSVDFVREAEAFALNSPDAQKVMDSPEEFHIYGIDWSSGVPQFPDPEDDEQWTTYLVRVDCHIKPGDDLYPTFSRFESAIEVIEEAESWYGHEEADVLSEAKHLIDSMEADKYC